MKVEVKEREREGGREREWVLSHLPTLSSDVFIAVQF
jgi:hypothetical protein